MIKKIISVVGARPNFMKVAPIHKAFSKLRIKDEEFLGLPSSSLRMTTEDNKIVTANYNQLTIQHLICHTGQHYDEKMSDIFFHHLGLPKPDYYLGIGSGSHAEQTARIMIEFEKVLLKEKPDLVIVVGDVNSTIACSLTAKKLHIKVAHIEAGLRSFDRDMPEELNRILTDSISDYLFVTEQSGLVNLKNEGVDQGKIFFVGNCMIDSLINILDVSSKSNILNELKLDPDNFVLVTMHRPSNVDTEERLTELVKLLSSISKKRKIVFPVVR